MVEIKSESNNKQVKAQVQNERTCCLVREPSGLEAIMTLPVGYHVFLYINMLKPSTLNYGYFIFVPNLEVKLS